MPSDVEPEVDYYHFDGNEPTMNGINGKSAFGYEPTVNEPEMPAVVQVALEIDKAFQTSTVSYHALSYDVNVGSGRKRATKRILHELSGIFMPGMNAIMGPTGSGKTSLLDILSARTEPHGIHGHVLVNGQPLPDNYKFQTGYVVQDDVVVGTLTVRENLMFSANLRLPKTKTTEQKRRRVEKTILELGLTRCADTKVGTEFIRGVSGGERKRTNIGMELIIKPAILFLDEPTTGLDASTANAVMSLLHSLSRSGRTVIFSIHQPRFSIFKLFDRLSLLAAGRAVYHGPASEALSFFKSAGYICEEFNNPPDFFLDTINGDSTALKRVAARGKKSDHIQTVEVVQEVPLAEQLSISFKSSEWAQRVDEALRPIMIEFETSQKAESIRDTRISNGQYYKTSFLQQINYVARRCVLNLIRNPRVSFLQIFISVFFAVILGIIYLQLGFSYPAGLQDRVGSLFFICVNQLFTNMSGLELFIKERVFFIHENASGFYRVSSYFFSKIFADFIPMRLIPLIFFSVIVYFMIGYQVNAGKFFIFFLVLFLTTIAGVGVVFAISASVDSFAIANLAAILTFIMMMIFGGLFVNLSTMPDWLSWLRYLSIIYYSFNALIANELDGETFYVTNTDPSSNVTATITGAQYLTVQGIPFQTPWDFWQNVMAVGLIGIGMLFIAYIQLRRMKKLK